MRIYNTDLEKCRNKTGHHLDRIVIFGCGGHARSIINVIAEKEETPEIILVDENADDGERILGIDIFSQYELKGNDGYIVAIGDNRKRKEQYSVLKKQSMGRCISIISDYASVGIDVKIGNGTFIAPNAYIGPQTEIGDDVIINTGSVIEHETQIGNHTHIAPNATICGRSRIGEQVFGGAGSVVIDQRSICSDVIIGAGAVIVENITIPGTYVGVPARKVNCI